jgi:hypothetical protein
MSTTVTTWADNFGTWHAKVSDPIGWGNAGERNITRHIPNIRQRARRAIRREILARESGPIKPIEIEIEKTSDPTGTGVIFAITFRERQPR